MENEYSTDFFLFTFSAKYSAEYPAEIKLLATHRCGLASVITSISLISSINVSTPDTSMSCCTR